MKLTPEQFYALGRLHGATPDEVVALAGAAGTESGFDTGAVQAGGLGRGLFQIDLGQHPDVTEAEALDPNFAMGWAVKALRANGGVANAPLWYGPRDHPADARQAALDVARAGSQIEPKGAIEWGKVLQGAGFDVHGDVSVSTITDPIKAVAAIGSFVLRIGPWLAKPHNLWRIVEGFLGSVVLLIGLSQLGALPAKAGPLVAKARDGLMAGL